MRSPFVAPHRRRAVGSALVACAAALLLTACGSPLSSGAPPVTVAPPVPVVLTAAEPDVALAGATVTLRGSGFVDDLELRVGGVIVAGSLLGPDALTFVVPDTTGYPVVELGEASVERLLFVGAEYTGDATATGVQAALDALPPGIALRLPARTITGDHLVVGERSLYGSGSEAGGTRLELQGSAWLVLGADLAELHLRASQVILSPELPTDPPIHFDPLALTARTPADASTADPASVRTTRVTDVAIDVSDERISTRGTISANARDASVTFEDVRIDGLDVDLYVDAFVARRLTVHGPGFSAYAITTLDVSDAVIDVVGHVDLMAYDLARYALERVVIDAGLVVTLRSGAEDPGDVATMSDLRVHGAERLSITPEASARLRNLDVAGAVVQIESGSHDLDLETATVYADDGVRLLADDGALRLVDVDVTLGPDAADALHDWNPTSLEVHGRLGVEVRGGTWKAGPTALLRSEAGTIAFTDLHVEADDWIEMQPEDDVTIERASLRSRSISMLLEVDGSVTIDATEVIADEQIVLEVGEGVLTLTDVHLDGFDVGLFGRSGVVLTRATIAAHVLLQVYADGPIEVDAPSFTVGAFELVAEGGSFTIQRGRLIAIGRVVLSSQGGPGVIEDMQLWLRSQEGFSAASDVRLEVRRTVFAFAVPIVFDAPPGHLVLEDVTGAGAAETPGQR